MPSCHWHSKSPAVLLKALSRIGFTANKLLCSTRFLNITTSKGKVSDDVVYPGVCTLGATVTPEGVAGLMFPVELTLVAFDSTAKSFKLKLNRAANAEVLKRTSGQLPEWLSSATSLNTSDKTSLVKGTSLPTTLVSHLKQLCGNTTAPTLHSTCTQPT
jgi:hypothetical protein